MKTDGIKKAEAETVEEEPVEELNFRQKLLRLFGLYYHFCGCFLYSVVVSRLTEVISFA